MTFDELLSVVSERYPKTVPRSAEGQLKASISEEMQAKLLALPVDEGVRVIVDAVDAINHGSVETIEVLGEGKSGSRG